MSTSVAPIAPLAREDALVVAARAGDERAFETLHARYRERIEAFIAARLRDPDRAEDIAQEVFVSAHRSLCSSDRPIVFRPWIYEIAGNACVDGAPPPRPLTGGAAGDRRRARDRLPGQRAVVAVPADRARGQAAVCRSSCRAGRPVG